MKFDSLLEEKFAAYLKVRGFSEDTIISQPAFLDTNSGHRIIPDFAIIDPKNKEQLAVIEILSSLRMPHQLDKIEAYSKALEGKSTELFFVTPSEGKGQSEPFTIYKLSDEGKPTSISWSNFPTFNSLTANKTATERGKIETDIAETADHFRWGCYVIASTIFLLVIADFILKFKHINLLTPERLTALGIAIAVFIIPFAAKFKGFGIEYERYTGNKGS